MAERLNDIVCRRRWLIGESVEDNVAFFAFSAPESRDTAGTSGGEIGHTEGRAFADNGGGSQSGSLFTGRGLSLKASASFGHCGTKFGLFKQFLGLADLNVGIGSSCLLSEVIRTISFVVNWFNEERKSRTYGLFNLPTHLFELALATLHEFLHLSRHGTFLLSSLADFLMGTLRFPIDREKSNIKTLCKLIALLKAQSLLS